ncbi:ABC transporter substrate-binding protein [Denitratisoma sp. DHT3]|nr:ABC transporter substrate-binding protein [Denitratisoma sp. DHT3]
MAAACLAALALAVPAHAEKLPRLVLAGPAAAVSVPLIHMVETGALKEVADSVEFVTWKDPDQLRVLALGGKADFLAMPSNVAANLYNRGQPLKLLNISTWGVLWMVSRDKNLKTLADFRGKEIAMPFRADMPDIVFGLLAERLGMDPKKDFALRYVASPLDAMQLLITRRVDHALLAEPAVSMALRKTKSFPISVVAPDLYRSVDLQQEWGRLFKREARLPQAGITVLGKAMSNDALQAKVMAAYEKSLAWCQKNARQCGEMVAKRIDLLSPEAVADSLAASPLRHVSAAAAREELTFFFQQMLAKNPALVGGKLPDAGFYGNAGRP